ncbi:MAG: hypothetical protein KF859_00890 [Phycisphaeraceae bacterium]|nr:hypothetical protein [Phycisphaeraceae bacterium]
MNALIAQIDWTLAGTAVSASATFVLAVLTAVYVHLTKRLLDAHVRPYVVVRVHHDHLAPTILLLVIENVGKSVAYNVKFKSDDAIPEARFGINVSASEGRFMKEGPLVNGIPALAPADRRVIIWGQYGGLKHALGDKPLRVEAAYTNGLKNYSDVSYLEVDSFAGTDASDRDPMRACAKHLEGIERQLKAWGSSSLSAKVQLIDSEVERKRIENLLGPRKVSPSDGATAQEVSG